MHQVKMNTVLNVKKDIEVYLNALEPPTTEDQFKVVAEHMKKFEATLNKTLVKILFQIGKKVQTLNPLQLLAIQKSNQLADFIDTSDLDALIYVTGLVTHKIADIEMESSQLVANPGIKKHLDELLLLTAATDGLNKLAIKTLNISSIFKKIPHAARFMIDIEAEFKTIALSENQISPELFKASINEIELLLTNIFAKVLIYDQYHIKFFLPMKEGDILFYPLNVVKDNDTGQEQIAESGLKGRTYSFPTIIFDILLHPLVKAYDRIERQTQEPNNPDRELFFRKIRKITLLYNLANNAMKLIYP